MRARVFRSENFFLSMDIVLQFERKMPKDDDDRKLIPEALGEKDENFSTHTTHPPVLSRSAVSKIQYYCFQFAVLFAAEIEEKF